MDFEWLYSSVRDLPIVDWHNHLDLNALVADAPLGSLYSAWVAPDPYKHRAMRICGEPERLVTGDAPEAEKWAAWKRTLPKLVGNPLFDWAKAELGLLGLDGAENVPLSDWTPSKILRKVNAEVLSPCVAGSGVSRMAARPGADAPGAKPRIVPSLRLNAGDEVPEETLERFAAAGCRVVDISVDDASALALPCEAQNRVPGAVCPVPGAAAPGVGAVCSVPGAEAPGLFRVAAFAAAHGWTMLLHLGALRATSARLRAVADPAGGYAGMRAPVDPAAVAAFLDALERADALPHTILLTLNPEAHAQLAVLSGSFTREGSPGHVQLGPAWWWCDHAHGVRDVLEKTAAYGVLSTFVGMTTDSRSLLSLARHDWFRRTLCKWVAGKVASGDFPDDPALLKPLLENVCYRNARRMFDGNR
ncbi:MAG: glucuronate isomerase [Kiritimatiellae bacterium]|nr:glucuronate isomerase [Kiritimatiellia bacterium]